MFVNEVKIMKWGKHMEDNKQLDACVDEIYTLMPKWHTKIAVSYTHLTITNKELFEGKFNQKCPLTIFSYEEQVKLHPLQSVGFLIAEKKWQRL